ncbi:hypothetical protein F4804DRAFT_304937 [Jackrogersella minutella]|nr:hypothetical protein F4804DRAFT_304937 [Jackrogersella minutella]
MSLLKLLGPIGIGTDICQTSRIYKIMISDKGTKFIHRLFSKEERGYRRIQRILFLSYREARWQNFSSASDNAPTKVMERAAEYIAGRFAAKEAVKKAYSLRELTFGDIIITYEDQLKARLEGKTAPPVTPRQVWEYAQEQERERALQGQGWDKSQEMSQEQPQEPPPEADDRYFSSPPVAIITGNGIYEDAYARVSISHDGDYATAMCLAHLEEPRLLGDERRKELERNSAEPDDLSDTSRNRYGL